MEKRAECIAFANQKGGTGKTTSCLSIAGFLAKNNGKVLVVDFDPQTSATSALIRWQKKDTGLVSPGESIPVLEKTGMIIEVGEWIFRTACMQAKEWHSKGYHVPVSINISPVQFMQKDLPEKLERIIKETKVDPKLLTMEITESAFMHDIEFTNSVLKNLRI